MKIRRFIDKDRRTVMAKVREEMGPDAVVLSSKTLADGFSLVAACDYDPERLDDQIGKLPLNANLAVDDLRTLAQDNPYVQPQAQHLHQHQPQPQQQQQPQPVAAPVVAAAPEVPPPLDRSTLNNLQDEITSLRAYLEKELPRFAEKSDLGKMPTRVGSLDILRDKMHRFGLSDSLTENILKQIGTVTDVSKGWRRAMILLRNQIRTPAYPPLEQEGVIALVGPSGSGKTTILTKLAARYVMQGGRKHMAIISMDCHRFGAQEQIRRFARCLRIPVEIVAEAEDLPAVLDKLADKKLILIDTGTKGPGNSSIAELLRSFGKLGRRIDALLTVPATLSASVLEDLADSVQRIPISGVVISKIDESLNLGPVLDVIAQNRWPVCYTTSGPKVPQDLETADADQLLQLSIKKLNRRKTVNSTTRGTGMPRFAGQH